MSTKNSLVTPPYRTHTCGEVRAAHQGQVIRLSGWLHRKRDHGQLLFFDLRDHYGLTQCVLFPDCDSFSVVADLRLESVITVLGTVVSRAPNLVNTELPTGEIELVVEKVCVQSQADPLPLQVNGDRDFPEETRLTYRFLDLRRERLHQTITLRSMLIARLREKMQALGFCEFQTPILTASSPEGARDYLVPSRIHPGCFYALPQSPQQFKQLLMVAGFDRYFQIAPCFRDEDGRADRSPGEFYQLDIEMAFVTQEDIFSIAEPLLYEIFQEFAPRQPTVTAPPFPRIPYHKALLNYGTDKPDLRNPLMIQDMTTIMAPVFQSFVPQGSIVRAIRAPGIKQQSRPFFERLKSWAQEGGMPAPGYIVRHEGEIKGPLAKFLTHEQRQSLTLEINLQENDGVFFLCGPESTLSVQAGQLRTWLGENLGLVEENAFRFCWIVDFPLFTDEESSGKGPSFFHNPFSMPQGGLEALCTLDPLMVKAYQYDIVCNGCELSSGAIRNHLPDVMIKAFEIAGYAAHDVERQFGGLLQAFRFGAPPHGGIAPGIDRLLMLLTNAPNLREVIAFPMNQRAEDLLMHAPSRVEEQALRELRLACLLNRDT